jgi:hypothetical protein
MKQVAFVLGCAAAIGAAAVIVTVALRNTPQARSFQDVPGMLEDCQTRIREIETELNRMRPA